jgi:hypothetical protein
MRARDCNPATAEFTSVDPALATTGQPYAYVGDGPTCRTDPTGLIEMGFMLRRSSASAREDPSALSGLKAVTKSASPLRGS